MIIRLFELLEIKLDARTLRPANPFVDVAVSAVFRSPDGALVRVAGFHDGERTWRVRFTPGQTGLWSFETSSTPADTGLKKKGTFEVTASPSARGFLRATPGQGWGLHFDSGEPLLLVGDTQYNLFAAAHSGLEVQGMLRRRRKQGFNTLRARLTVSPFHPNSSYCEWMSGNCWLWGGSPQAPDFTRFNLHYLRSLDSVFHTAAELGMGIELILEAWLMEFPFNDRKALLPEYEDLMIEQVMARFSAFTSLYIIDPANEYNLHLPDRSSPLNDRFAARIAGLARRHDPHRHPVGIHVTAAERMNPPFQERFRDNPDVDVLLMQTWGDLGSQRGISLVRNLEDELTRSVIGSGKVNILAEYGYEAMPLSTVGLSSTAVLDEDHTRRGALKAVFMGLHVMSGFQTTWGPRYSRTDEPSGAAWFSVLNKLMHEVLDFSSLRPRPGLVRAGRRPALLLADAEPTVIALYLPEGGGCSLHLENTSDWTAEWLDPKNLALRSREELSGRRIRLKAPAGRPSGRLPDDQLVILRSIK